MVAKKELNKYINKSAVNEVLGSILTHPELLKEFKITTNDFVETFHKLVFGAINNLAKSGVKVIDAVAIDEYLSHYETQYILFKKNNRMQIFKN